MPTRSLVRKAYPQSLHSAAALAAVIARHRLYLAPLVHTQMRDWQTRAAQIEQPQLRAIAQAKLAAESFNAEAAAVLASAAPAAHRQAAVEAILALEIAYDYLDGLTEQPLADPLAEGLALYTPFLTAAQGLPRPAADPYLSQLASSAAKALAQLPAHEAIAPHAAACAQRAVTAQVRLHAAGRLGTRQLEGWAMEQASALRMPWRQYLAASACSILALHALIAAAADPSTTPARAEAIEAAYLPLCAAVTLLDGVLDAKRDRATGTLSYAALYEHPDALAAALAQSLRQARRRCGELPDGSRHLMVLAATVAYWLSAPEIQTVANPHALAAVRAELRGQLAAPLAFMRIWRAGKQLRHKTSNRRGRS